MHAGGSLGRRRWRLVGLRRQGRQAPFRMHRTLRRRAVAAHRCFQGRFHRRHPWLHRYQPHRCRHPLQRAVRHLRVLQDRRHSCARRLRAPSRRLRDRQSALLRHADLRTGGKLDSLHPYLHRQRNLQRRLRTHRCLPHRYRRSSPRRQRLLPEARHRSHQHHRLPR